MNYVTVDAYRIGEFPYWFHQIWASMLQLCISLVVVFKAVGLATIAALVVIILTVVCNIPFAKLLQKFQSMLVVAQDERLKTTSEALLNMKILKLYGWETHFMSAIENLRKVEHKWLSAVQLRKAYQSILFWSSPFLVSLATFGACYFLGVPLHANNVFTFLAAFRLVQDPISSFPDVLTVFIQAKIAFARIVKFLEAQELETVRVQQNCSIESVNHSIFIEMAKFSWEESSLEPTVRDITLRVRPGEKVAICGEVGSGKSTILAAILGEVPKLQGTEYVFGALLGKTVLLVTHQVDFLPAFDIILFMSGGKVLQEGPYHQLLVSNKKFQDLVNAHKEMASNESPTVVNSTNRHGTSSKEIRRNYVEHRKENEGNQLIQQEERETGDKGFKPYRQYLKQNKGFFYFFMASISHLIFAIAQILQNIWLAAKVDNPHVSTLRLVLGYFFVGLASTLFLICRCFCTVVMGLKSSESLFSQLLNSLFHAPMSFHDSTPLGRIFSRVSSDLSTVDLDVPFSLIFSVIATMSTGSTLVVLAFATWKVLFVFVPLIYLAIRLQRYYFASAKELMRINGTTKSLQANHLAESIAGAMTIRAFEKEDMFFARNLDLTDKNASPFFHNFSANEWLIQRIEMVSAAVLASTALCMVLFSPRTLDPGLIGMALSYGLSLNSGLVRSIKHQCQLANNIISVERLKQYMNIPSEAPQEIEGSCPAVDWPAAGKVEIEDLQVRYRPDTPLVLLGISCTFEGGQKIGIVGRTGSGKSTLISALFRLVEPAAGRIMVDGIDISKIGLRDLRSRFGIIPQDPTLFNGTVRYNLDPLSQYSDEEIWEVIGKCRLEESLQEKGKGLDALVVEDGSNWSMGQRQLFCLGRVLLRRSRVLVLDEATASMDDATDMILQKTIRTEFADCTVITVAHRIPTVMDCNMVAAISDGKLMEYDAPANLMKREDSLFGQLVKEYWSRSESTELH